MHRFAGGMLAMLCFGCSHVDTGQIDYRVAEPPSSVQDCSQISCGPLSPSRLDRKYLPGDAPNSDGPFQKDDVFSINLEGMVVGNKLLEGVFFGKEFGPKIIGDDGEIAILVNIFEFSDRTQSEIDEFTGGRGPLKGNISPDSIKLVYFSGNVKYRQPINFSSIPIHPRTKYNGGSIGIQIVVIEVDSESSAVNSLLSTLAEKGLSSISPASGTSGLISNLGKSLFSGSGDDLLLDYRFALHYPNSRSNALPQADFVPGRYVILRKQDRTTPIDWGQYRLDHNTGRLFRSDSGQEVREELYLTLHINRYPKDTAVDTYQLAKWNVVRKALEEENGTANAINALNGELKTIMAKESSSKRLSDLYDRWSEVKRKLHGYERVYLSNARIEDFITSIPEQNPPCRASFEELAFPRDRFEQEISDHIREFAGIYQKYLAERTAANGPNGQPVALFHLDDREKLLAEIVPSFLPWQKTGDDPMKVSLNDAQSFEKAYIASGGNWRELAKASFDRAATRADTDISCSALVARGLIRN